MARRDVPRVQGRAATDGCHHGGNRRSPSSGWVPGAGAWTGHQCDDVRERPGSDTRRYGVCHGCVRRCVCDRRHDTSRAGKRHASRAREGSEGIVRRPELRLCAGATSLATEHAGGDRSWILGRIVNDSRGASVASDYGGGCDHESSVWLGGCVLLSVLPLNAGEPLSIAVSPRNRLRVEPAGPREARTHAQNRRLAVNRRLGGLLSQQRGSADGEQAPKRSRSRFKGVTGRQLSGFQPGPGSVGRLRASARQT